MMLWYENFKASLRNEKGQGMVEYGLILALIAVAVVGTLGVMGDD
ncbi:MAG: Flp family type IVb pilin, partial [Negativicutes bacterium]|nr:Flp family type IVb pilin [Negativicutes bacterium]